MPIKPTDAKKLATMYNTMDLKSLMEQSDELMRMVMEAGDMDAAEEAAQTSAEMAAALIARKQGVRELANRVRARVAEEGGNIHSNETAANSETPAAAAGNEAAAPAAAAGEAAPQEAAETLFNPAFLATFNSEAAPQAAASSEAAPQAAASSEAAPQAAAASEASSEKIEE